MFVWVGEIVVVFSDGQDTTSNYSVTDAIEKIKLFTEEKGTQFTMIGFRLDWLNLEKENINKISFALDPRATDYETNDFYQLRRISAFGNNTNILALEEYEKGDVVTLSLEEAISTGLTYVSNFITSDV